MRLLTKTTLYFLLALVPLLAAGGYFLFWQFSTQINERADKELVYEEVQWIQYLEAATANGSNFILRSPDLLIYPSSGEPSLYPEITTTYGTKARENIQIPFRQLAHIVDVNGVQYQLVIRKSQEQKLALVANITSTMLLVFAGLFFTTLLFNWIISKRLWRPFRDSLQKVRNLELQQMQTARFGHTAIKEFNELNASLNTMVERIQRDYLNMKEFTENAAHEMQTPLAVAQSKLEILLQDSLLTDTQLQAIVQTTEALTRLGKLNQSLLLLAKIENHQFQPGGTVSLTEVTRKYLRLFDEMIKDKHLDVDVATEGDFTPALHPFLADSLVSNLLGNAIKYNEEGGKIRVQISTDNYCIWNSSQLPPIGPAHLYQRFPSTAGQADHSTGLGLAIVKRIADTSGLAVHYKHVEGMHSFCLRLPAQ